MADYRFDRLSESNLHYLLPLYKACFNLKVDINYLKSKYKTVPFGTAFIGYLAFETNKEEVAGYYGVFPITCAKESKIYLAAQSGDTMTHPKHQGKGLFTKLARLTYELAKEKGIHFIFGFPNNNSYPGFINKLDWKHYSDINNYIIRTGSPPFDKVAKKFPFFSDVFNWYWYKKLKKFLVSNETIPNSLQWQCPGKGFVVHDQNFFDYKTYSKIFFIKIENVSCVIKIDGRMWVGDIQYCTEKEFIFIIDKLKQLASKLCCSSVQFSVFNDSYYDRILRNTCEIKSKNPVGCLNLSGETDPETYAYQAIDFDTY